MTEFSGLEVGKPSPFPAKPNFDGGYFEADENGFLFLLYIQGITAKEKRSLKNEIIRVRTIREDNKLLMMIRFGTSPIIFELSFDPTLYRDGRAYDLVENVNTVQIIGIDSKDNKLQLLRFVSVPAGLLNLWKECWQSAAGSSNFSQDYNRWLNSHCEENSDRNQKQ